MIIDCHYHLEEEMFPLDKMIESMNQNGIHKTALIARVIPAIFGPLTPKEEKLTKLYRHLILNYNPLAKMMYHSLIKKGEWKVFNKKIKIEMAPDNNPVMEVIKKFPDRFLGWIFANPTLPGNVIEEVDRLQSVSNMIGVKVLPYLHEYKIECLEKLAGYCQERNLLMLVHLSAQPKSYRYLPEKFPRLKIIYAHAGLPYWRNLWRDMNGYKNVYIDLSSDYLNRDIAVMAVKAMGYQKCLYGTDGPYGMSKGGSYDYSRIKRMIEQMALSEHQKEAILGDTFSNLLR